MSVFLAKSNTFGDCGERCDHHFVTIIQTTTNVCVLGVAKHNLRFPNFQFVIFHYPDGVLVADVLAIKSNHVLDRSTFDFGFQQGIQNQGRRVRVLAQRILDGNQHTRQPRLLVERANQSGDSRFATGFSAQASGFRKMTLDPIVEVLSSTDSASVKRPVLTVSLPFDSPESDGSWVESENTSCR